LIVAANGLFLERRTSMFTTCARVLERNLGLDDHAESCRLHSPRLPRVMHRSMLAFFRAAHARHGGEAALVLLYHWERRVYRWFCPEQTVETFYSPYRQSWVAGDTIRFEHPLSLPDGFVHFGDAHLHPGSPTPSALDVLDDQDGLHIIVGDLQTGPRYNVEFVVDRRRFGIEPAAFFADVDCAPFSWVPRSWMKQLRIKRLGESGESGGHREPARNDRGAGGYLGHWQTGGFGYA
jgi:hypothetical protein